MMKARRRIVLKRSWGYLFWTATIIIIFTEDHHLHGNFSFVFSKAFDLTWVDFGKHIYAAASSGVAYNESRGFKVAFFFFLIFLFRCIYKHTRMRLVEYELLAWIKPM